MEEPCKVLIVDDSRDTADSAVMLIEAWGHEARAAYSAEDAVQTATSFDPDVVLMDLHLPGSNGFLAAEELRACCPGIRIVALTGYTQADIVRRARQAGFSGYLVKPPSAKALKRAIEKQCAQKQG